MRLGGPVGAFRDFEEWADLHISRGYGAAYCPISVDSDDKTIDRLRGVCERHDLVLAEVGAWCNPFDRNDGEKNILEIIRRLRFADRIGARCCVNISGSRGDVWDGPDPLNLTQETFDAIVAMVRRIVDEAAPGHANYTLEPMPWMYPCDIESQQRLLDAVDRDRFQVHVDMCNIINSYEKTLRTGSYTHDFFAAFGKRICAVHLKDTVVTPRHLTLHIDEAVPGRGIFDHASLLRECDKLDDVPVMLEHLASQEEYEEAAAHVKRVADGCGLVFRSAR